MVLSPSISALILSPFHRQKIIVTKFLLYEVWSKVAIDGPSSWKVFTDFIDSDKVYIKREFLKVKEDYSKEKISNIFDSIEKYVTQKDTLLAKLEDQQNKTPSDNIQEIIELEEQLSTFIPMDITQADKIFDKTKITELTALINSLNNLLEK